MNTSFFFHPKLNNKMNLVSVAGLSPKEILDKFPSMKRYDSLIPPKQLVLDYKNEKITKKEYTIIYHEQLFKLDPFKVYDDLKDSVILCWENPGKFCHRHLISKWLMVHNGVFIGELF